jgi:hypothetical protein
LLDRFHAIAIAAHRAFPCKCADLIADSGCLISVHRPAPSVGDIGDEQARPHRGDRNAPNATPRLERTRVYWFIAARTDITCLMRPNEERTQTAFYLLLLAIQVVGAIAFVWQQLPEFRQVLTNPGEQLPKDVSSDLMTAGILFVMQVSFWYRLLRIPIPFRRPNVFLNHLFLFLGRLSFIFGSALFSVVVFRHLPELGRKTDILLAARRGLIFVGCLFALFCTSLEVERLGQAFAGNRN